MRRLVTTRVLPAKIKKKLKTFLRNHDTMQSTQVIKNTRAHNQTELFSDAKKTTVSSVKTHSGKVFH